jgi:hypothetical protein
VVLNSDNNNLVTTVTIVMSIHSDNNLYSLIFANSSKVRFEVQINLDLDICFCNQNKLNTLRTKNSFIFYNNSQLYTSAIKV